VSIVEPGLEIPVKVMMHEEVVDEPGAVMFNQKEPGQGYDSKEEQPGQGCGFHKPIEAAGNNCQSDKHHPWKHDSD